MKQLLIILGCFLAMSCNSQKQGDDRLIGKWDGSLKDSKTGGPIEKIILEFTKDGKFLQHSGEGKMQNTVESTYEAQDGKIITVDKETHEKAEGKYAVKNDTLTITFEGMENKYIKLK
ncbi:hypothetical protein [Chryseobacterium shigense]|uniref:TIGR03066 family protein n=1 Tax=Chryseobacterium shigense TaxID=297244 RepID=A0A841N6S1_9FLAO|nr:hypothetical protein [Chryseobacterium shigense]MBB6370813.1 hypothetical protein [Chryseobacterium shigense]